MACNSKRVMTKRWDKRELPHWGSTVSLAIGDPIRIPKELRARDIDEWNRKVMAAIEDVDRRAEERIESLQTIT